MRARDRKSFEGNAAMIHTVDMQHKCLNVVSHMFLQPILRGGRKCNLGQFITKIWKGSESCFTDIGKMVVGRATKAKGIQLCLN